jgi:hypothetical protein
MPGTTSLAIDLRAGALVDDTALVGLVPDEKRQIIENVVERITIGKGEVSIDFAYVPPSRSGKKATRPQGFIAFTTMILQGPREETSREC